MKLIDIAKKISRITSCKIIVKKQIDIRSYRQNSDKLISTGFKQKFSVIDAINEMKIILTELKFKLLKVLSCKTNEKT